METKKTILFVSLIIIITGICGTAEAKAAYTATDLGAGTSGPYGMKAGLQPHIKANITNRDIGVIHTAGMREVSTSLAYSSYIFTTDDIIFFSYEDGTTVEVYDSTGNPVPVEPNILDKGEHTYVNTSQGVYLVAGSNKFAVLTGDATTNSVSGYYAMNAEGYGVSREFYTYVPALYEHCEFIVFAYGNGTQVTVQQEDTNGVYTDIATFTLDRGKHWANSSLDNKYLHIIADKPVSALTCYDQSYFVPSASGKWSGTEFYTYLSDIADWPEDLTVIAYDDNTSVVIKDSNDSNTIWSGILNSGQAHVVSYPNGADKYFTITSSKPVAVDVQPWVAMTSGYNQGVFIPDKGGSGAGTELIGPTSDGGYLYILAHTDNTHIDLYDANSGAWQAGYTLNKGETVNANPGNGLWKIASDKDVSAYSGWEVECTAEFAPLIFNKFLLTLEKTDDVNDGDCVGPGDEITYTICYSYADEPNLPVLNDVNIVDHLPTEVDFNSASNGGVYEPNSHTVTWNIGTLEPNESSFVTLTVKVKCAQPNSTITNEGEIKSGNQTLSYTCEDTPVCPNYPTLTNVDDVNDGNCVGYGETITYYLYYDANGYGDTNVKIDDNLPPEVNFVSATGDWQYNSGIVTWNIDFPPDACGCIELVVQVNSTAKPSSTIINHCEMWGDCISPVYADENTPICPWQPTQTLTKVDDVNDGNCVGYGETITYYLYYDANGYGDTNVVITDFLPDEVNYISSDPNGSHDPNSNTVTWDIGYLPADACGCIKLVVQVNSMARPCSIIINRCDVTGDCIQGITAYESAPTCLDISLGSYVDEVMADDPCLYLRFGDDPYHKDSSGNNYWAQYGPATSIVDQTAGGMGKSIYMTGTGDSYAAAANRLTEPPSFDNNDLYAFADGDITFEFWWKGTQVTDACGMFFQQVGGDWVGYEDRAPGLGKQDANQFCILRNGGWDCPGTPVPLDGLWHHIVVAYDEQYNNDPCQMLVKMYLDSALVRSIAYTDPNGGKVGPEMSRIIIGAEGIEGDRYNYYNFMPGYYDEFAIYPGVLSACRVAAHYAAWQPRNCDELMDRGYGMTADLTEDCKVNFYDFADFASDWITYSDPNDPNTWNNYPPSWPSPGVEVINIDLNVDDDANAYIGSAAYSPDGNDSNGIYQWRAYYGGMGKAMGSQRSANLADYDEPCKPSTYAAQIWVSDGPDHSSFRDTNDSSMLCDGFKRTSVPEANIVLSGRDAYQGVFDIYVYGNQAGSFTLHRYGVTTGPNTITGVDAYNGFEEGRNYVVYPAVDINDPNYGFDSNDPRAGGIFISYTNQISGIQLVSTKRPVAVYNGKEIGAEDYDVAFETNARNGEGRNFGPDIIPPDAWSPNPAYGYVAYIDSSEYMEYDITMNDVCEGEYWLYAAVDVRDYDADYLEVSLDNIVLGVLWAPQAEAPPLVVATNSVLVNIFEGSHTFKWRLTAPRDFNLSYFVFEYKGPIDISDCNDIYKYHFNYTGDLNGDCHVDFNDLDIMAEQWLICYDPDPNVCP